MALFEDRARLVRADFVPDGADREVVGEICRLVGGMPLAIELAAAWVDVLSLRDIAAEIRRGLGYLETEWGDVANRHRSVSALFETTYQQLSEEERAVFRRVSVFRGGFSRWAAEEVAGASLAILTRLVHKSLLHYSRSQDRYEVHELLRQFGAGKLARDPGEAEIQNAHSEFFCRFLAGRDEDLKGERQAEAFAEIEAQNENVLAAWHWAVAHLAVDRLDAALEPLDEFLYFVGRDEEREEMYGRAIHCLEGQVNGVDLRVLVKLRVYQASAFPWKERQGAMDIAQSCLNWLERLEVQAMDVRAEKAKALEVLFDFGEETDEYLDWAAQSLALYRDLGDLWSAARVLASLGNDGRMRSRYQESKNYHEESLALRREIGDATGTARTLAWLAMTEIVLTNYEGAVNLARESLKINRAANNERDASYSLYALGWSLTFLGRNGEARQAMLEETQIIERLGIPYPESYVLLGLIEMDLGMYQDADAHANKGLEMARVKDARYVEGFAKFLLGRVALVRGAYEEAEELYEDALEVFSMDRFLGGDTQACLASLHYILGDTREAVQRYRVAFEILLELQHAFAAYQALYGVALIYAEAGELEYALELVGLAETAPHVRTSRWIEDLFGPRPEAATAGLPAGTVAAARARGRARALWEMVEELLVKL